MHPLPGVERSLVCHRLATVRRWRNDRDVSSAQSAIASTQAGNSKMKIERVGVMSPGDMGQAVAIQLKAQGRHVYTALERRSERSRALAREAGMTDVGTIERLVAECDVVLSIMDPGAAVDFARAAAKALRTTGRHTLIVDCNAISPDTVHEI